MNGADAPPAERSSSPDGGPPKVTASALDKPVRDDTVDLQGVVARSSGHALPFPPGAEPTAPVPPPPPPPPSRRASLPSWYTPEAVARPSTPAPPAAQPPLDRRAPQHAVAAPNPIADQQRRRTPDAPAAPQPRLEPTAKVAPEAAEATSLPQLLWFHAATVPRMRREKDWAALLSEAAEAAGGVEAMDFFDVDEPLERDDRRDVAQILGGGQSLDLAQARQSLIRLSRKLGRLVTPLVLLEGVLRCQFDEVAQLEVALGATRPFAAHNEKLRAAVAAADAFLEGGGSTPVPALAQTHTNALGAAIGPSDIRTTVDGHVRRTLVEKRAFKRRKLLGQTFVRASLRCDDPDGEMPQSAVVYIPEPAAALLPLFERIPVRLIGEFTPRQEQAEATAYAVKLAAVARLITLE